MLSNYGASTLKVGVSLREMIVEAAGFMGMPRSLKILIKLINPLMTKSAECAAYDT